MAEVLGDDEDADALGQEVRGEGAAQGVGGEGLVNGAQLNERYSSMKSMVCRLLSIPSSVGAPKTKTT